MNRSSIFSILPLLTHATCLCLVLFVLISPAPFSISSVSLLKVEPFNLNSTASTSSSNSNLSSTASGITFGGVSTSGGLLTSSQSLEIPSSISESSRSDSRSSSSSVASPTSSSSSSSPSIPTSIEARGMIYKRSHRLERREQLSNMTGPGGIPLNGTEQLQTASSGSTFSSKVELSFGPLGSCFTDGEGNQECTSAKLSPKYDSDKLNEQEFGSFITTGLLDRLPTTPILLLVVLIILILTLGVQTLITLTKLIPSNPAISTFLEAGPRNRALSTMRKYSVYASTISWLILLCSIVSMRIYSSKAATSFNASNSNKSLPSSLVASNDGNTNTSNVLGLKAQVGSGFTMLRVTIALLGILLFLERRSLKHDQAVAQARADIEARHGRFAFQSPHGEMQQSKSTQQLPFPNENQPYGASYAQYSSPGSIYNGYPVSAYSGGKSRPSSPAPTTHTRAVSPAPTYRGGGPNAMSNRSYWLEDRFQEKPPRDLNEVGEEMSWRLVGDRTGTLYN